MTTILLDPTNYDNELLENLRNKKNVTVINTTFSGIEESYPVAFRCPEGAFYGHVDSDRMRDVIGGHAHDLKIQTARYFSVDMKRYISEEKYRLIVIEFTDYLDNIKPFSSSNITKSIHKFSIEHNYIQKDVIDSLNMSLIKTTKGPFVSDLMEAFGKKETLKRIDKYLKKYKYRF